jgi:hypothetical protein
VSIPYIEGISGKFKRMGNRYNISACQLVLQHWVSLGLLYNRSPPGVRFLNKIIFYRMGLLAPCPTPILEDLTTLVPPSKLNTLLGVKS